MSYLSSLHVGDGGRAEVDGGGGGLWVSPTDENTHSSEAPHHLQLDGEGEGVGWARVLHLEVVDSSEELLGQQSYTLKNQLVASKAP